MPIPSSPEEVPSAIRHAIESKIEGATAEVTPTSPGHFEIRVVSKSFDGKSMLQQQQLVYAAITHLMQGADAPVHAVDRLRTAKE